LLCLELCDNLLLVLVGVGYAATVLVVPRFASVGEAVATLPELSILNAQVKQIALANELNSPDFVGTVFAPINAVGGTAAAWPDLAMWRAWPAATA
jgi:hypothetical protein